MAASHRPPLPQPPAPRHAAASPYLQPHPHAQPHAQPPAQAPYDPYAAYRAAPPQPSTSTAPYGTAATPTPYVYDGDRRESYPSSSPAAPSFGPSPSGPYSHSPAQAQPYQSPGPAQGPYGAYPPPPSLGEFGQYPGAPQQPQRAMGEFEQLAHEHYAGQGASTRSTSLSPLSCASRSGPLLTCSSLVRRLLARLDLGPLAPLRLAAPASSTAFLLSPALPAVRARAPSRARPSHAAAALPVLAPAPKSSRPLALGPAARRAVPAPAATCAAHPA